MTVAEDRAGPGAGPDEGVRTRRRTALALCLAVFPAGACFALVTPLLSVLMRARGASAAEIGVMTAMFPLGVLIAGPFVPILAARLGSVRLVAAAIALLLVTIPLFPLTGSVALWYALRVATGIAIAVLWVLTESWLNAIVPEAERGRWIGLYSALIVAGFVAGPAIPALTGSEGMTPFLLCVGLTLAACVPVLAVRRHLPILTAQSPAALPGIVAAAPSVFLTAAVAGFCEYAAFGLIPVFVGGHGFGEAAAFLGLTLFGVGNVLLQLPLGVLLDRMEVAAVTAGLALTAVATAAALGTVGGYPGALWPLLVLCGGAVYGLYTAGLTDLGRRFPSGTLSTANAAFVIVYELGALAGPPIAGSLMDALGPAGLPLAMGAACVLLLAMAGWRRANQRVQ